MADQQPEEYWVNVYECPNWATKLQSKHSDKILAEWAAAKSITKCIYRIHVKMKPIKSSFIRQAYHKSFDKFDWMGD